MDRAEKRSQKRKDVVEAVVIRNEPVALVSRVFNLPARRVFDWLARYRQGGWQALSEKAAKAGLRKSPGQTLKWLYDAVYPRA